MDPKTRKLAYGQDYADTWVDRFGAWLSRRRLCNLLVSGPGGKRIGDFGCGFRAQQTRSWAGKCRSLVLVDVGLDPALGNIPGVELLPGVMPGVLDRVSPGDFDLIVLNSVLEHLDDPGRVLQRCHALLAEGGVLWVNVPNWRGKFFLELSAFRLGLSPKTEMDDHRNYYDPRDLWPMLVAAGFKPSRIRCRRHKFGLATFAAAIK